MRAAIQRGAGPRDSGPIMEICAAVQASKLNVSAGRDGAAGAQTRRNGVDVGAWWGSTELSTHAVNEGIRVCLVQNKLIVKYASFIYFFSFVLYICK